MSNNDTLSRALLLAPLLTSTASLTYALSEVFAFLPFLRSPANVANNTVIGHYWKTFLYYGGGTVITFNAASTIMGASKWRKLGNEGLIGTTLGVRHAPRMFANWLFGARWPWLVILLLCGL